MRTVLACLLVLACISVASSEEAKPAVKPVTNADTIIAVYTEDWGRASSGEPKLVLAIWEDGHSVWSEDRVQGGAPYRSGRIDPKKLSCLLARLDRNGVFTDKKLSHAHFGPDSKFTAILLKSGKKQLKMQSWHELFEANGKTVVATNHGIELLEGRRRLDVLRQQPAEYLYYRLVWSEIRAEAAGLIPREGKPVEGEVVMEKGIVSWQESPAKPKKKAAAAEPEFGLRVTPTEFFSGELKRLEHHLDFRAACFKIARQGSARCRPQVEMWSDGKRVDSPKYGFLTDRHSDEVTLSWRRAKNENGVMQYRVVVGGMESFGRVIDEPKSKQVVNVAFGPITIRRPVELKAEGSSVIVWAKGDGHGADLAKPEEVQKMLNTAPWVLVLRLTVEKEE